MTGTIFLFRLRPASPVADGTSCCASAGGCGSVGVYNALGVYNGSKREVVLQLLPRRTCRHDAGARSLAVERCFCSRVATCWAASDGATSAYWKSTSTVAALQLEPHQAWRGSAARHYAKSCVGGAIAADPANCTRVAQLLCPTVCSMRQEMVVPDRSSSETLSRVSTHTKSCSLQCQWSQVAGPPEQLAAVLARGTFAWHCRAHCLGSCAVCDSQVAHSSAGSSAGSSAEKAPVF